MSNYFDITARLERAAEGLNGVRRPRLDVDELTDLLVEAIDDITRLRSEQGQVLHHLNCPQAESAGTLITIAPEMKVLQSTDEQVIYECPRCGIHVDVTPREEA